jgi:hypothetical protein
VTADHALGVARQLTPPHLRYRWYPSFPIVSTPVSGPFIEIEATVSLP